jgi:hypothetical protein
MLRNMLAYESSMFSRLQCMCRVVISTLPHLLVHLEAPPDCCMVVALSHALVAPRPCHGLQPVLALVVSSSNPAAAWEHTNTHVCSKA